MSMIKKWKASDQTNMTQISQNYDQTTTIPLYINIKQ